MCSSSSVLSVSLCLLLCLLLCVPPCLSSGEPVEIKVKPGEAAILPCQSPGGAKPGLIRWIRPGQSQDNNYVFLYRSGKVEYDRQLQSYRGRVELKDPEMKNGDVSVVLSHVNINDAGRYQCLVVVGTSERITEVLLTVQTDSPTASTVEIYEGESVQLPCKFPTGNLDNPSVVWSRSDLRPPTVHQRLSDRDKFTDQNQDYRGRTSMRTDALRTGDLSLTLKKPTTTDRGDYNCIIRAEGRADLQRVTLRVKEPPPPPGWMTAVLAVLAVLAVPGSVLVVVLVVYCIWSKKWITKRRAEQTMFNQQLTDVYSEDVKWSFVDTKVSLSLKKSKNQQQDNSDRTKLNKDLKAGDLVQIMEDLRGRDRHRGRYMRRVSSNGGALQREMTLDLEVEETTQDRADGTKMLKRNNSDPPSPMDVGQFISL